MRRDFNTSISLSARLRQPQSWYMTAAGLLFWNLGSDVGDSAKKSFLQHSKRSAFVSVSHCLPLAFCTVSILLQGHYFIERTQPNQSMSRWATLVCIEGSVGA